MKNSITLKIGKKEITWLFGLYIMAALYLLYFSPICGRTLAHRSIQMIPFKTILDQLTVPHGMDLFLGNMAGNILILFPAGFFLALLSKQNRLLRTALLLMTAAFFIELFQYILWVGCMDIDDIWMNATGGIMGFVLGKRLKVSDENNPIQS
jgi:glycopeptide antibiotics resistance protein